MEIISNSDKSNDLPVLDYFIHQVFDQKATSTPIRELSQLEEVVTVNSSVNYMNCPMSSKAEESNPKPGTSKVLPPNDNYKIQMKTWQGVLRTVIIVMTDAVSIHYLVENAKKQDE